MKPGWQTCMHLASSAILHWQIFIPRYYAFFLAPFHVGSHLRRGTSMRFLKMKMRGEDPTRLMPYVQQHLDMCPDCREEYEALLEALHIDQQFQG